MVYWKDFGCAQLEEVAQHSQFISEHTHNFQIVQRTLATPPFILYTRHSTLDALGSTLHTYTQHSPLYTPHFTLYALHCPNNTLDFTPSPLSTLCTLHFTVYILHSTLYHFFFSFRITILEFVIVRVGIRVRGFHLVLLVNVILVDQFVCV